MMKVKGGCQVPNGPFTPADPIEVFGEGVYIIMQGELDRLPKMRELAPGAFIIIRFYLQNWYTTDPVTWARECWHIWTQVNESDPLKRRNCDLASAFTWANEQNLKHESGGAIGSSPGDMIKPGQYEIIRDWNLRFLDEWDRLETASKDASLLFSDKVFPALASGNSDDQDDGAGVGLEILAPVIARCKYGAIHIYWQLGKLEDEWVGLGRIQKQLKFFGNKPVINTETGNFAVTAEQSPAEYQRAYYIMQGNPRIFGFCYFIYADPTKQHQQNDMSRNPKLYDWLKSTVRIERVETDIPPIDKPVIITDPNNGGGVVVPGKELSIGYQIWQYNALRGIDTYAKLEAAMNAVGAGILSDKFADSDAFQATFDPSPMAVDLASMKQRAKWCADRDMLYLPWHVPRAIPVGGDAFVGAAAEGKWVGEITKEVGLPWYMSDLEFYEDFFGYALASRGGTSWFADNGDRNRAARLHYEAVRAANPDIKIILQPDPRQDRVGDIDIPRMVQEKLIDAVVYQSYANFFMQQGDRRDHRTIIQDSINKGKRLEIPWGICLYVEMGSNRDTTTGQAKELLDMAVDQGARWVFLYKAPITPALQPIIKSYSGNIEMPEEKDTIDKVQDEIWKIGDQLLAIGDRATKLGYPWLSTGITGLGNATKAYAPKNKGEK